MLNLLKSDQVRHGGGVASANMMQMGVKGFVPMTNVNVMRRAENVIQNCVEAVGLAFQSEYPRFDMVVPTEMSNVQEKGCVRYFNSVYHMRERTFTGSNFRRYCRNTQLQDGVHKVTERFLCLWHG